MPSFFSSRSLAHTQTHYRSNIISLFLGLWPMGFFANPPVTQICSKQKKTSTKYWISSFLFCWPQCPCTKTNKIGIRYWMDAHKYAPPYVCLWKCVCVYKRHLVFQTKKKEMERIVCEDTDTHSKTYASSLYCEVMIFVL